MNTSAPPPVGNAHDISLGANLRRLQLLTRDWPGVPLDNSGAIRLLNPDAPGLPLFWCFNGRHEFPALAAALAQQRPVVGMRSLNQIIPGGPARYGPDLELANHYATTLLRHFGPVPCLVGGNCQAAMTAHGVALRLLDSGAKVARLITVDAVVRQPYPAHLRLLFSANSPSHNPFLTQIAPDTAWRYLYRSHDSQILGAAHGQFFLPTSVTELACAIEVEPRHTADLAPPGAHPIPWTRPIQTDTAAGSFIELTALAQSGAMQPSDLAVLAHWQAADRGAISNCQAGVLLPVQIDPGQNTWRCWVQTPDQPGDWTLALTLCNRQTGPQNRPDLLRIHLL